MKHPSLIKLSLRIEAKQNVRNISVFYLNRYAFIYQLFNLFDFYTIKSFAKIFLLYYNVKLIVNMVQLGGPFSYKMRILKHFLKIIFQKITCEVFNK